jgi:predicted acetyltransferase
MADTELAIRTCTSDDFEAVSRLLAAAFHHAFDAEPPEHDRLLWEPDRSLVATDGDTIVGHANSAGRELSVPGGAVPAAHVTGVGVAPTHRRRGVLTRLMGRQLRDVRAGGQEPLAVLWASEGRIYPRFGYGLAVHRLDLTIDVREVRLPPATAVPRLRVGNPADLRPELAKVYDEVRVDRPGWSDRGGHWWSHTLVDLPRHRRDATELHAVVHEADGGIDGYALWRTRPGWTATGPDAEVQVREVTATNPDAYAALWRFLLGIDLARTATYGFATMDEPLLSLANEPRRLGAGLGDSLWVRVVDVPAALAARRYLTPIDVVIEVTDPLLPENTGRWRLAGGPDGARCDRTTEPADLACDVVNLGAAYLGGPSLATLAAAGRVRELRAGSLGAASLAFGWHRAPGSPEVF